ncbi:MAG: Fe-S cluster assembly ATPase SufC [Gammaproteobacteria bacterium]|nr:Fe-S cluster assembly ATPase SufC [Gammaproteobacteria bacterium]
MLTIQNLQSSIQGIEILKGIDLTVKPGEVHVIMGPNGSGKSTLAQTLAGREDILVTNGSVQFLGQNLLALSPEARAQAGLFLAFQYPVEIPGVSTLLFLKTALNSLRKARGEPELDALEFLNNIQEKVRQVKMDERFLQRSLNEGFSGGEKKRSEILQMLVLDPKFAILDETDSGLDIDALKVVAEGVNSLRKPDRAILVVTHYLRLLEVMVPDIVHILWDGRIIKSGDKTLARELEQRGYEWLTEKA